MTVHVIKQLWALRGPIITVLALLVLLPLVLSEHREARCGYVVLVMAVMWLTEAIPIPATALLPIFMFPMCGVQVAQDVSKSYISDTSMLFLGGLILAVAVEEWNLHKRIAIGVLRIVGSDPKFVMLGLMLPTWFLSMWISNTATASMMIPIANAVVSQMGSVKGSKESDEAREKTSNGKANSSANGNLSQPVLGKYTYRGDSLEQGESNGVQVESFSDPIALHRIENADPVASLPAVIESTVSSPSLDEVKVVPKMELDEETTSPEFARLCKGLSLCIAYGCNIGGIATLTGTPPNLVFKGTADDLFNARYEKLDLPQQSSGVTFANWMGMALPMSAITLVLAWVLLMLFFLRGNVCRKISMEQRQGVKDVIMAEWKKMGPMSMAEIEVTILFVLLAAMWISRDPKERPGWSSWFMAGYVSDASAVMVIVALLFLLPAQIPRVFCCRGEEHADLPYYRPLLTWEQVHRKLPWGVIILLGGGFALANACKVSGLSAWLGNQLNSLASMDPWLLNLILCLIVATATEVTSNTATSTLLMPIMAQIAIAVKVNPLYLMASAAMATSFAFMLPVATPPNAIVFAYGNLRVYDMASVGFFMNIIAVLVLTLAVNTWGNAIFNFDELPVIFRNLTAST
ncbi:Na(+)/citrate cotransporter-like [Littorina saxatilis]|uniref:Solute carrier family 13 member 5 n=1 Tax=Littorina saxatilis TaxID=31220 RepID=A0AAN9FWM6_9CAEN